MPHSLPSRRRFGAIALTAMLAIGTPLIAEQAGVGAAAVDVQWFRDVGVGQPGDGGGRRDHQPDGVRAVDDARTALIDVEVYDRSGRKIFQKFWDDQSFTAGQVRQLTTPWTSEAAGAYTVKVGTFSPGWGSLIQWNDTAGAVTVVTTPAPTTPAPTTPVTTTPAPHTPAPTTPVTTTPQPGVLSTSATANPSPVAAAAR